MYPTLLETCKQSRCGWTVNLYANETASSSYTRCSQCPDKWKAVVAIARSSPSDTWYIVASYRSRWVSNIGQTLVSFYCYLCVLDCKNNWSLAACPTEIEQRTMLTVSTKERRSCLAESQRNRLLHVYGPLWPRKRQSLCSTNLFRVPETLDWTISRKLSPAWNSWSSSNFQPWDCREHYLSTTVSLLAAMWTTISFRIQGLHRFPHTELQYITHLS